MRDLSGLPARRLAYAAIEEVLRRSAPLDDVFDRLAAEAGLEDRDEGLARAIAVVAFRRHGTIRRALSDRLQEGLRDGRLGALMTAGAAQILFLNVPDHAAVDLSVELARAERLKPFAGLVNAVLRRIAREREAILSASDPLATDTPGRSRTAVRAARRIEPVGSRVPPRRAAQPEESSLAVTSRAAPSRCAVAMAAAASA